MMLGRLSNIPKLIARNGLFGFARQNHSSATLFQENDLATIDHDFRKADRNMDNLLDLWEFNTFSRFTMGRKLNEVDLKQLFELIDGDKDGQVSQADIIRYLEKRFHNPTTGNLEYAFCTYDKDDDGRLALHEVRQALYYLGFPGGEARIKELFHKYDSNNDNRIELNQFVELVTKGLKP